MVFSVGVGCQMSGLVWGLQPSWPLRLDTADPSCSNYATVSKSRSETGASFFKQDQLLRRGYLMASYKMGLHRHSRQSVWLLNFETMTSLLLVRLDWVL